MPAVVPVVREERQEPERPRLAGAEDQRDVALGIIIRGHIHRVRNAEVARYPAPPAPEECSDPIAAVPVHAETAEGGLVLALTRQARDVLPGAAHLERP